MDQWAGFKFHEQEKIDKVVFHHPMIVAPHLAVCVLILLLNFFLMYYLFLQGWWGIAIFCLIIFVVVFYVFRVFFLFRRNKVVITNERIVDFEQISFFERFVNEFSYAKIKEAKAAIRGIGPTLFHYGNLRLFLKEDVGPFELYRIPEPLRLQNKINDYIFKTETGVCPEKHDPVSLIMAQMRLLTPKDKEELWRRIKPMFEKSAEEETFNNRE